MADVSRHDVKQMVIELTLGVSKEDSQYATQSERHAKRWDQIEGEFSRATSNIDVETPDPFDSPRAGAQSDSA